MTEEQHSQMSTDDEDIQRIFKEQETKIQQLEKLLLAERKKNTELKDKNDLLLQGKQTTHLSRSEFNKNLLELSKAKSSESKTLKRF